MYINIFCLHGAPILQLNVEFVNSKLIESLPSIDVSEGKVVRLVH